MIIRRLTTWLFGFALLVTGVALAFAQQAQPPRERSTRADREKLRAQIVKLRTEVEMARFDYDYARDDLLEGLKTVKGLKMGFQMLGSVRVVEGSAATEEAKKRSAADRKKERKEEQAAEEEEKKDRAEMAEVIAKHKPELIRLFTLLSEKRMDLEDAERQYREAAP